MKYIHIKKLLTGATNSKSISTRSRRDSSLVGTFRAIASKNQVFNIMLYYKEQQSILLHTCNLAIII